MIRNITVVLRRLIQSFQAGHERSLRAKMNILYSFFIKGISILIGLILVPLTINYVSATQYGMWLTLSSIISWFSFFDVGLGNGLKNKLAESNALGDITKSRTYVSTTYAVLALISTTIFSVFFFANTYIDWNKVLNVKSFDSDVLSTLALLVLLVFCVQFVSQIINVVLTAVHRTASVSFIAMIGQLLSLIAVFCLVKTTKASLIYLVFVLGGIPILVQIIASAWLYTGQYSEYRPSLKFVDFKYAKDLLSVGGMFFFIQIGALVLFQTSNIIITQILGPSDVTVFNVAFKLFSVVTMIFTIVITPFWAAFTEAYAKKDLKWIQSVILKMRKFWLLLVLITFSILVISPYLYKFWLGDKVKVPFVLSAVMSLYVVVYAWQTIHVYLLNGIGKVRLQLYLVLTSAVINIPLSVFLGRYMGVAGVTLATVILFSLMSIVFSMQCKKILNGQAYGIWDK